MKLIYGSTAFLGLFLLGVNGGQATDLQTALDGLRKVSFGRESALAIGDTVDVLDPSTPKERCVKYDNSELVADSSGAVESKISYRFVRDLDQFENTFKVSYTVEATSSANFAKIIGGESTLKNFGTFENFLKRDKESALIIIEASALHGRDFVRDFELKDEYKQLIAQGKFKEFRARCGTHMVRGWNRKSSVDIIVQIDNVSSQAKLAIENTMGGSTGGTVSVADILSASGKISASTTISDTLQLASKMGKVSARVEAVGGAGIGTIAAVVNSGNLTDPQFMDSLLKSIAEAAKDFTYANAAPDQFILVPHPQVAPNNVEFDAVNFEKLEKIYKTLIRVDQRAELYKQYKDTNFQLWARYFRVPSEKVTLLRDTLVKMYQRCRNNADCSGDLPGVIDGVILDDFLALEDYEIRCIHSYAYTDTVNGQVNDQYHYLSSMAVVWKGDIKFLKAIEPDTAKVSMITPDFSVVNVPFEPNRQLRIAKYPDGEGGRIFLDLYRESINPNDVVKDGQLSIDALRDLRRKVGQSVFIIRFQTIDGHDIEQALGRPSLKSCPITDHPT